MDCYLTRKEILCSPTSIKPDTEVRSKSHIPEITRAIYIVVRDRVPYCDRGTDYEALPTCRTAPRWLRQFVQFGRLKDQSAGTFRVNREVQFTATNPT